MSNINSWNIGEPAILTVLFPILFIMSDDTTPAVDPVVPSVGAPCTDESCADGSCSDESCSTPAETPVETVPAPEATPAE